MLKNFHPVIWIRIEQNGRDLFIVDLVAWAFALWVASALGPDSPLHRVKIPGAYHLALWSYSIYLVHKPVGFVIRQQMQELAPSMMLLTIVAVSLALGAALYYLVELPFMRLRDARFPHLTVRSAQATVGLSIR